ncbi:hypothetical protein GCM10009784_25890 [Arthrobacter parietis]|nr:hypothetical protein ASH00_12600 [Arthrobacter sp. Soil782]
MIVLALALPVLGGCGGAEALDPGAAQSLQQQVRELAVVTQEGNLELAVDRAEALKAAVQQAEDSGAVTPGRAERIQQNIEAFINSVQPAEVPAPTAPAVPSTEPAPVPPPPTFTAPAKGLLEDSRDPGETQTDRDRERAEEVAEELQEQAEKQEKERQKQEEENSGED